MAGKKPAPLVPRLRFPEFRNAGDWTRGYCRDIARVLPGYGFPDKFQGNKCGQYPFYKVSDISQAVERRHRYISDAKNYINSDVLCEIRGKLVPTGTVIFAKIGEAIRSNRRVITSSYAMIDNNTAGIKAIKGKMTEEFLLYLWSNVRLIDYAGGVVPAVSISSIQNIPLRYPSDLQEQEKIAGCLGSLDDLIAAQGRELEALRQHKKGLMQQLFPQPGETVPRLRFPEFRNAGEWEVKRLGELITTVTPPKKIQTNDYQSSGQIPIIDQSPSDICGWTDDETALIETDFPVVIFGDHSCVVKLAESPFAQGADGIKILSPSEEIDALFLFRSLQANPVEQKGYNRHFSALKEKLVPYPRKEPGEQEKIAGCLGSLDELIRAQGEQVETLKTHKRGLMQQLFPWEVG